MYVLMITPNKFPNGDAGAVRDYYFAKIYQELGYDVVHIGEGEELQNGTYEGIQYYISYKMRESFGENLHYFLNYSLRISKIYSLIENSYGYPGLIHIYDIPAGGISWATHLAKKLNIPIIHDSVEWYSPCEFRMGRLAYPYLLKEITNRFMIRKPISVIAISTYLEKYFQKKHLRTVRIPVIMDKNEFHPQETKAVPIELIYAGSPAKKDCLCECVQAFQQLPDSVRQKFRFRIFGANEDTVSTFCGGKLPTEIIVYGRTSRDVVIEHLARADFALLLRPDGERYTKAGFPTKVVEAMMNGCAMICNITSDLGRYLDNEGNAIVLSTNTIEEVRSAFEYMSKMSTERIDELKSVARNTAVNYFDYRVYIDRVRELIG